MPSLAGSCGTALHAVQGCRHGFSKCRTTHTRCKKYLACYFEGLYSVDACDVCSELRDCIHEYADTEGAVDTAWALRHWSNKVSRNCGGSNRPEDAHNFWYDQDEREGLLGIFSTFCNHPRPEPSLASSPKSDITVFHSINSPIFARTPSPAPATENLDPSNKELLLLVSSLNAQLAAFAKGRADKATAKPLSFFFIISRFTSRAIVFL